MGVPQMAPEKSNHLLDGMLHRIIIAFVDILSKSSETVDLYIMNCCCPILSFAHASRHESRQKG